MLATAVVAAAFVAACAPAGRVGALSQLPPDAHPATSSTGHPSKDDLGASRPLGTAPASGADAGLPQIGQVCTARADWRNTSMACWSNPTGPSLAFAVGAYALHANDASSHFVFHYTIANVDGLVAKGKATSGDQLPLTLRKGDTLSLSLPSAGDVYSLMVEAVAPPTARSTAGRPPSPAPTVDTACALNSTDTLTECWSLPWRSIDRYDTTITNPDQTPVTYFLFNPDGSRSPDYTLRQGESQAHALRPGDMVFGTTLGTLKITALQDTNPTGIPAPTVGATCSQPGTTNVETHACWRLTSVDAPVQYVVRSTGHDATYEIRNSDGLAASHALAAGHAEAISMRPNDTLSILTTHSTTALSLEPGAPAAR